MADPITDALLWQILRGEIDDGSVCRLVWEIGRAHV